MLRAGLTPDRAFEEIARRREPGGITDQVWRARTQGQSLTEALTVVLRDQSSAWRSLGAAWEIARVSGAPMGPALESLSRGLRDQERTSRLIDAELAAPHATMRLVGLLPIVAVLGGALGGVNSLSFLFLTTPGRGALVVGVGLLVFAWWWMRVMVRRVVNERTPPSPRADLFLIALGGGVLPRTALQTVDRVMRRWDFEKPPENDLEDLVNLSIRAGVPVSSLVRAQLDHARDVESTSATREVGSLSVRLVLPLGLLVLPAFLLMAVVPLAWGLSSGNLLS